MSAVTIGYWAIALWVVLFALWGWVGAPIALDMVSKWRSRTSYPGQHRRAVTHRRIHSLWILLAHGRQVQRADESVRNASDVP